MKNASFLSWLLAGGLIASTIWNITLSQRLSVLEAAPANIERHHNELEPLPADLVSHLGLTKEQCRQIRDYSQT